MIRNTRMTWRIAASALLIAVLGLPVCVVAYWLFVPPYLERRAIETAVLAIPDVELARITGDLDVGITASMILNGGRALELAGVTTDSFGGRGGGVFVSRVADLGALTTGCPVGTEATPAGPSWSGESWTHSLDLHRDGHMSKLLTSPLNGVEDAVARYDELLRLFDAAPRCPDKLRVDTPDDFPWKLFYCVSPVRVGEQVPISQLDCRQPVPRGIGGRPRS